MSNLNDSQFEPKKPRWVPDKGGTDIGWHMMGEHGVGSSSVTPSKYDFDKWNEAHMKLHEDGVFIKGQEHQHFTPASWKKYKKK